MLGERTDRLAACLQQTSALHGHLCPRQVLGVRIGLWAGEVLDLDLPRRDKRLYAFVETDGCFVDGLSAATGCSLGHRTMRLVDLGKVAAVLVDTHSGRAVRLYPRPDARAQAIQCAGDEPDSWHAQLRAYQTMPAHEMLAVNDVDLLVSVSALVSRPGLRVRCERCGEEIMNEREVTVGGRTLCGSCAGRDNYYVAR